MVVQLLAQQYIPISPRHVSLLTLDGGSPAAVVALSSAYDRFNRVYFFEWDCPSKAETFRLVHTAVPGGKVNALSLVLSQEGVVHCVVQCSGGDGPEGSMEKTKTYVLRRTEDADGFDSVDDGYNGNEEVFSVRYKVLPKGLEDDDRDWTVATRLNRGISGAQNQNHAARIVAACGGERGQQNALKVVYLSGTRLLVQQTIELPVLSTFPVLQLAEVEGDDSSFLALCHHAVLEIDPRLKQQDTVVRAWKWTARDPLTSFAVKDNSLVAGTEDGVMVLWDLRFSAVHSNSSVAVDHSASCGAPITGMHMPHSSSILSCQADGSVLTWGRQRDADVACYTGSTFVPQSVSALPPVFVGSPGCVALAGEDRLAVVADESGTLSIFTLA